MVAVGLTMWDKKNVVRLKDGVLSHLRKTGKDHHVCKMEQVGSILQQDQWKYEESNVDRLKSPLAKTEDLKHQHPS